MNWLQFVLFLLILGLCIWLVVDTIIYIVKKVKDKKSKVKEVQNNDVVDNDK